MLSGGLFLGATSTTFVVGGITRCLLRPLCGFVSLFVYNGTVALALRVRTLTVSSFSFCVAVRREGRMGFFFGARSEWQRWLHTAGYGWKGDGACACLFSKRSIVVT